MAGSPPEPPVARVHDGPSEPAEFRPLGRDVATLLVVGVLLALIAVASGHLYSIDGLEYFRIGERILFDRSLGFDPPVYWGGPITYPITPLGLSFAYLPALALAAPLLPFQPGFTTAAYDQALLYGDPVYTASSWVNPLIAALTVLATASLAHRFSTSRSAAIWMGLAALFAGPLFFYARADWPQPLSSALLVTGLYLAVRARQGDPARHGAVALVVAAGIVTRPVDGIITAAAIAVTLVAPSRAWVGRPYVRLDIVEMVVGSVVGAVVTLGVNTIQRGGPLAIGPAADGFGGFIPAGLAANLVSPGRGLFWYLPLSLLAMVGAVLLWRSRRRMELLILGFPIVAYLLVYAQWSSLGGWSWGPRYLVPIVPLVVLIAGSAVRGASARAAGVAFAGLGVLGVLENLANVGVDQLQGFWGSFGDNAYGTPGFWRQFEIGAFAPIASWSSFTGTPDVMWMHWIEATHGWSVIVLGVLLVGAVASLGMAVHLGRRPGARADP